MKSEKRTIDFKYNFKEYLGLIAPYKWAFLLMLFFVFLVEAGYLLHRFLFKAIVDKGELFLAGTLAREGFVSILLIIAAVYVVSWK